MVRLYLIHLILHFVFVANYDTSFMIFSNNLQTMFAKNDRSNVQSKLIMGWLALDIFRIASRAVAVLLKIHLSETEKTDTSHCHVRGQVFA